LTFPVRKNGENIKKFPIFLPKALEYTETDTNWFFFFVLFAYFTVKYKVENEVVLNKNNESRPIRNAIYKEF